MPEHQLDIQWCVADRTQLPDEALIRRWANVSLDKLLEGAGDVEVCLRVVDAGEIQSLNRQYRREDKATNVLAFPNDGIDENGRALLGDIVICSDIVVAESATQSKSVEAHFAHLLIHGLLHLQGHDHSVDDQANKMEAIEIDLLKNLGYGNPYE